MFVLCLNWMYSYHTYANYHAHTTRKQGIDRPPPYNTFASSTRPCASSRCRARSACHVRAAEIDWACTAVGTTTGVGGDDEARCCGACRSLIGRASAFLAAAAA